MRGVALAVAVLVAQAGTVPPRIGVAPPTPTSCVGGPVNMVVVNFPQEPVPDGACEICLMVSRTTATGEQEIEQVCGFSNADPPTFYAVQARIMYCGINARGPGGWEGYGEGYPPPLVVRTATRPPCAPD